MTTSRLDPKQVLANWVRSMAPDHPEIVARKQQTVQFVDCPDWLERNFYIVNGQGRRQLIRLMPHQKAILRMALDPANHFTTVVYSTVKKSGKTAIAAMVARWIAETWGLLNEEYMIANDLEQAKGRAYKALVQSIELDPRYDRLKRVLPDVWKVLDKEATHLETGTVVRSLAGDYKGEAGSNPTATFWSELWGYQSENSIRMWEELTPVPTREKSLRFVETYAGFENESVLLWDIYQLGKKRGQRIDLPGWPFEDPSPIYINEAAGLFMYWDDGEIARRMPWQTEEYYMQQAQTLRPMAFDRLHLNLWGSSEETFCPIEWWDNCEDKTLPPLLPNEPAVLAVDASVSHDSTALTVVSRHPQRKGDPAVRLAYKFDPPARGSLDYSVTLKPMIQQICKRYNIVQMAYDPYQMHHLAMEIRDEGLTWVKPFGQGSIRLEADRQLYDVIRDRRISHNGVPDIREHLLGANAKISGEEDTRFRIVKKSKDSKIDLAVTTSMGVYECLRLSLD